MRSIFTPQETRIIAFVGAMFLLGLGVKQCRRPASATLPELPPESVSAPAAPEGGAAADWDE